MSNESSKNVCIAFESKNSVIASILIGNSLAEFSAASWNIFDLSMFQSFNISFVTLRQVV